MRSVNRSGPTGYHYHSYSLGLVLKSTITIHEYTSHTSNGLSESITEQSMDFNDTQRLGQSDLLKSSFSKVLWGVFKIEFELVGVIGIRVLIVRIR